MQGPNPTNFPEILLHKPRSLSVCNLTRQIHWIPKYIHWTLQLNYMPEALQNIPQAASEDMDPYHVRYFLYLLWK